MGPLLSVQIVTWNSAAVIDACLASLAAQDERAFEVVVVDNASADASAALVEAWCDRVPSLTLVREPVNRGFCGGQNRALARATAPWILFLNPDAVLPPDFVRRAAACVERLPSRTGAVAPCILLPDGSVDSTGLEMDRFRRAYDRDRQGPASRRAQAPASVFACTGAVALLRRRMLDDVSVGGAVLDEDLFAYYDDLDLGWRAMLRGWACVYEPTLVAWHGRAARNAIRQLPGRPTRGRDRLLSVRNRLLVMVRCDRPLDVLVALPWLVPFEALRFGYLACTAPSLLRAYVEAVRLLPAAWRARRVIHEGPSHVMLPPLPWRVR